MFTVEIKINGAMIAHVYGHNRGDTADGKTRYYYEYYEVAAREVRSGSVEHLRKDGIVPLISAILTDAEARK